MKKTAIPFLSLLLLAASVTAVSAAELKFDTPSVEYIEYMELPPEEQSLRTPPMQAKLRTEEAPSLWTNGNLPEKFDLRSVDTDDDGVGDTSYITPLRNQLMSNDCWAFAFAAAAESRWKYQTGADIDFSELHMDYSLANKLNAGQFNPDGGRTHYGTGGQALMAAAYAARGSGMVLEEELPFNDEGGDAYLSSTYISPSFRASAIKVSNFFGGQSEVSDTMINCLKADLMNGSAITIHIYLNFPYENDLNGSYYNNSAQFGQANHAVSIVGWDDTYPAENFNVNPGRDGAWIVRDNYELEVGDQGYRYLSYMDKSAYDNNVQVLSMEDYRETGLPYNNRYYYDSSWFINTIGYTDSGNVTYGMNVFDKQAGEESVAFVNLAFNGPTDYEVYILDDVTDPTSVDLSETEPVASGHSPYAGYFDIPLDESISVSGDQFAVIVKYHADDAFYIVPIEQKTQYPYVWYDYYSTAPEHSSYTSPDGGEWEEISTPEYQANCTIKVFTEDTQAKPQITFDIERVETTVSVTDADGRGMTANTDGTYSLRSGEYSYTAQREGYADVAAAFTIEGDATVRVTEPDEETGVAPYVNNEVLYSIAPYDETPVEIEFFLGTGTKAAQGLSLNFGGYQLEEGEDYYIEDSKIILAEDLFTGEELYEGQGQMLRFTIEFDDDAGTTQEVLLKIAAMDAVLLINTYIANHLDATQASIKAYADTLIDTQVVFGDDFEITPFSITGRVIVTHAGQDMVQDYTGYGRGLAAVNFISERRDGFMYQTTQLASSPYELLGVRYYGDGQFESLLMLPFGYITVGPGEEPSTIKFLYLESLQSLRPLMRAYEITVPAVAAAPISAAGDTGTDDAYTVTVSGLTEGRQYVILVIDDATEGAVLPAVAVENITYINQFEADGGTMTFGPFQPLGGAATNKIFLGGGEPPVYLGTLQSISEGGSGSGGSSGNSGSGGSGISKPVVTNPFTDVSETDWFYPAVEYAVEHGLFTGTSGATFSPGMSMTRAMLATVLYRAAGEPDMEDENWGYPFADVDAESWYGKAVYWARLNGITNGTGEETFSPDGAITREQLAVMLCRYAVGQGQAPAAADGTLARFPDGADVSSWSADAMGWAVEQGIITGRTGGLLDPKGEATRAEVAAMLMRYLKGKVK